MGPTPLHLGAAPGRELWLAVLAGPLVGLGQGLLAGLASLPVARRRGCWLLGTGARGLAWRHLLAATGIGASQGVVALLVVIWLPAATAAALGEVHPALPWLTAQVGAVAIVAATLWLSIAADVRTEGPDGRPPLGSYLLALVVAAAGGAWVLTGLVG